ncbi:LysM domain-containing protein [Iodidimonas sp. SYSU 1G8]|uniref:LysM peptidoglycan-binding domain-containing protein n=1 Tax=Iodidimonas sp. SYSU 1G8 TaxID=3133967 RepID=UPI0031FEDFEB
MALLTACASKQEAAPPPPPPPPVVEAAPVAAAPVVQAPVYTATPGLKPRERFREALKQLETGQEGQAKAELHAYIAEVPDNKRAQALLSQIEMPIDQYFPPENFTVTVATGETLSTLAQTFLGDALKFYALARYNGIANPSQVSVGQSLKIPRTPASLAAKDARENGLAAPPVTTAEAGDAALLEPEPSAPQKSMPTAKGATKGAVEKVRALAAAGDSEGAIKEIEAQKLGSSGLSPADTTFVADTYMASARVLKGSNPALAASRAQKAGDLYLATGDKPDKALDAAELASSLNPGGAQTQKLLTTAKAAAADRYYRNGLSAFRRQELDKAIQNWDRVLQIDPTHENAALQRAQAVELKEKLSKLR